MSDATAFRSLSAKDWQGPVNAHQYFVAVCSLDLRKGMAKAVSGARDWTNFDGDAFLSADLHDLRMLHE